MDERRARRGWWAHRLAAAIAAAALLVGGGVVLGTQLTTGASAASSSARVSMRLASDHVTVGTSARQHHLRRALLRGILRLGGERGQVTFATPKGTRTVVFTRGVIRRRSSGSFAVKDADGATLTWKLLAKTAVVRAKERIGVSALATGQRVFVVGLVVGGADEARLIIIRG